MAARSYLSRIAQPLTAADPLLWSVPQAASEEARPSVEATPTAALRRSPATAAPTLTPAKAAPPSPGPASTADATPADGFPAPLTTHLPTSEDRSKTIRQRITPADWPQMDDAAPASTAPATDLRPGPLSFETADDGASPVAQSGPIPAAAAHARTADRREPLVETPWPDRKEMAQASPDRGPLRPPAPSVEGPRLHIGAIEVRVSAPPAPVVQPQAPAARAAAPAGPSAPIGRAYAWRFGLVQG